MTERVRTVLLIATLMAATAGATAGIIGLTRRGPATMPPAMIVRLGQPPAEWHGWRLIPPSSDGCDVKGYDACSDDGEDNEPMDTSQDNEPTSI